MEEDEKADLKHAPGLAFIFVTLLIDVLGVGLLIPILPKFVATLSGRGLSAGARDYGLLLGLYGLMQFGFAPLLGALSDRFGRRPVLLLALGFTGLEYVVQALAPNLTWLYVGRILAGITGASFTTASAYIADVSPPEKRAQNFGLVGAAFGVGFIAGPALGGLLGGFGERVPFWAAAAFSGVNLIYGLLVLPESLKPENRRPFSWREANPFGAFAVLSRSPVIKGMAWSLLASNLALTSLQSTWVLFMTARFGWGTKENGFSLAVFGVVSLIFQVGLARILLPKMGERRAILIGLLVGAAEYAGYAAASDGWMIYAIMFAAGLSYLPGQATQGLLSREVGDDAQGTLQGALTSLASLTGIVGPVAATALFSYFTRPHAPHKIPGSAFFAASALDIVAVVIAACVLPRAASQSPATSESPAARR